MGNKFQGEIVNPRGGEIRDGFQSGQDAKMINALASETLMEFWPHKPYIPLEEREPAEGYFSSEGRWIGREDAQRDVCKKNGADFGNLTLLEGAGHTALTQAQDIEAA